MSDTTTLVFTEGDRVLVSKVAYDLMVRLDGRRKWPVELTSREGIVVTTDPCTPDSISVSLPCLDRHARGPRATRWIIPFCPDEVELLQGA